MTYLPLTKPKLGYGCKAFTFTNPCQKKDRKYTD